MTPEEIEDEFPSLRLGDLFRLWIYLSDNAASTVPISLRSGMKAMGGSHKRMIRILDAVEKSSKELLVYRVALNEDGTKTDRVVKSYAEAIKLDEDKAAGVPGAGGTRRVPGALTPHARLWLLYTDLLATVHNKMLATDAPSDLEQDLRSILASLQASYIKPAYTLVDQLPPLEGTK